MATRTATYQDVIDAPEPLRAELIDGELFLWPRPLTPHLWTATRIAAALGAGPGGLPHGWVLLVEPELWLGRDDPRHRVLVPDVAAWRRERFVRPPSGPGFTVPPDWVCEILSPSSVRHDRVRKAAVYASSGVPWMWIVDPVAETVEVHRLTERATWEVVAVHAGDDEAELPPFVGRLPLGGWWASVLDDVPEDVSPGADPRS